MRVEPGLGDDELACGDEVAQRADGVEIAASRPSGRKSTENWPPSTSRLSTTSSSAAAAQRSAAGRRAARSRTMAPRPCPGRGWSPHPPPARRCSPDHAPQPARASAPSLARDCFGDSARRQRPAQKREEERSVRSSASISVAKASPSRSVRASKSATLRARSSKMTLDPSGRSTPVGRFVGRGGAARLEGRPRRRACGRGPEQYQRRRHDVAEKTRRGHFFRAQAAADPGAALEHERRAPISPSMAAATSASLSPPTST